jgi:antitoxin VapB
MGLNIKNEETHRMAEELAALTGQSMSAAVAEALREKLARIKTNSVKERIAKIRREVAKELKGEPLPDHAELLYDDRGLPK